MKKIIFVSLIMASLTTFAKPLNETLITHDISIKDIDIDLVKYEKELRNKKNTVLPIEQEVEFLKQLAEFDFGRFLLLNKGLNGYWTSHMIVNGPKLEGLSEMENWLLHQSPSIKATQERFGIFQKKIQENLKSNMKLASIPCGVMDDLLTLDYTAIEDFELAGFDLDESSITLAKLNSKRYGLEKNSKFYSTGAWSLNRYNEFDVITSNGLNIYEPDDEKVKLLYKEFHKALKPGGILVTSFLTPPPALSEKSTWKNYDKENAIKQKAIFSDVIGVAWQSYRDEETTRKQLEYLGFKDVEFIYDSQGIFPTVVAKK
jgi:SAM-dependent methyltransferase